MLYFKSILIVSNIFNLKVLSTQLFPLTFCNTFKCSKLYAFLLFSKIKAQNASYSPITEKINKISVFSCYSFLEIMLLVQGSGELLKKFIRMDNDSQVLDKYCRCMTYCKHIRKILFIITEMYGSWTLD